MADQDSRPIIVALDVPSLKEAITLARKLDPTLCRVKVGMELYFAVGPLVVEILHMLGFEVFLDLKPKDIPNTVVGAIRVAASLGVWMTNFHIDGGSKVMRPVMEAVSKIPNRPLIIGVTVLTSMESEDLEEVGIPAPSGSTLPQVLRLANLAKQFNLDGAVCSGFETFPIREACGTDFLRVVPSIRLPSGNKDDQKRIVTPEIAIQNGANHLVIGRPITGAPDPSAALEDFNKRVRLARANLN